MTTFIFQTKSNEALSGRRRWNDFPFLLDKTSCLTRLLHHTHILSLKHLTWFLSYHDTENSFSLFNMLDVPLSHFMRGCRCNCFFSALYVLPHKTPIFCANLQALIQSGAGKRTIVKTPCCEKYAWKIREMPVQRWKSPSGHLQEINSMLCILR
jgi:hypothetical protein